MDVTPVSWLQAYLSLSQQMYGNAASITQYSRFIKCDHTVSERCRSRPASKPGRSPACPRPWLCHYRPPRGPPALGTSLPLGLTLQAQNTASPSAPGQERAGRVLITRPGTSLNLICGERSPAPYPVCRPQLISAAHSAEFILGLRVPAPREPSLLETRAGAQTGLRASHQTGLAPLRPLSGGRGSGPGVVTLPPHSTASFLCFSWTRFTRPGLAFPRRSQEAPLPPPTAPQLPATSLQDALSDKVGLILKESRICVIEKTLRTT